MKMAPWRATASGLAWIVFSPFAFLMATMATRTRSVIKYDVVLLVFGAWSMGAVVAGIGTIAAAHWARTLKAILAWAMVAVYGGFGVATLAYAFVLASRGGSLLLGLGLAAMSFGTAAPFFLLAIRQRVPG